jgi:protein involved in polysaccharide export with SLBB domain
MCIFLLTSTGYPEYCLQFFSSKTKQGAGDAVKALAAKGAQTHILVQENSDLSQGPWYKVRTAPVVTLDEAMRQKKRFEKAGLSHKIVIIDESLTNKPSNSKKQAGDQAESDISKVKSDSPEKNVEQVHRPQPLPPSMSDSAKARTSSLKQADAQRRDVTLTWDPSEDPEITGYKIYYDTTQGPVWDPAPADWAVEGRPPIALQKNMNMLTLHGLRSSKDYYFSVTAYKKNSNVETAYANRIIAPALEVESGYRGWVDTSLAKISEVAGEGENPREQAVISPGDVLEIVIPGQREMSRTYDVDPDGNIYLILVGRVNAAGLNPSELGRMLSEQVKNYIKKEEQVSVQLVRRERYVQILEGVRYPGWYRVPQKSHINDLIDLAGGLLAGADYSRIVLKRKTSKGDQEISIKGEISLSPDDLISIPFPKRFDEKIDEGDLLYVNIPEKEPPGRSIGVASFRIAEESRQNRIEVDRRGFLLLPIYGEFYINDMTPKEVTQLVMERLPKYLAHESAVDVNIVEKRHSVQVLGHVAIPGWHNVGEQKNLQEVLATAGGAIDGAVMSEVSIQREWGGLLRSFKVNLQQFNITGDPRLITPIHANDVIHVPISSSFGDIKRSLMPWQPPPERLEDDLKSKFKVFGAVHKPGVYEPRENMSLLEALVIAGGETPGADMSRIMIIRSGRIEVKFNMEKYLEGKSGMRLPSILRGDTVYVSHIPMTYFEPKDDEVFYVLGEVRNPGAASGEGFKLRDELTVIQAIALAGGPTDWANVKRIIIIRNVAGKQENIPYNLERAIAGKYPEINIYVQPNDVIYVP